MPLYEYKCLSCGREFEELCKLNGRGDQKQCPSCGNDAKKKEVNSFGISTTIDPRRETVVSPKEIDKVVGAAAEKRWEGYDQRWKPYYDKRQEQRRAGKEVKEITVSPKSDEGVKPFEHLGNPKEQKFRQEYGSEYKKQITDTGKSSETPVVMRKGP